ncbi:lipoprotein-anchoring transpeptidase ErfK/SrfK [Actinopolyspora biskrensis]|uniref:Lipoprotein-anchoring transpeptidase ErfK/SrfK n=1 Tax=Actinopolyspora biskrensis TaxID=1470178 RepID=A0A852YYW6_9ACTN|nr:lipoprotein-anchoring transpeptidase ErfK/SrfK [Actinopolyspora biskrensis]
MNGSLMRSPGGALVVVLAALLLVSGCAGASGRAGSTGGDDSGDAGPSVSVEPGSGANGVNPKDPIKVAAENGKLRDVSLVNGDGEQVEGELAEDGSTWKATEPLGYDTEYEWSGKVVGSEGDTAPVRGGFHTVSPRSVVRATVNPIDDKTVGVAMPISIKFDSPVRNKAAVQRALDVRTSKSVEGAWAWLNDKQVDWRPKEYWPAHTRVSVDAPLYGIDYGGGGYGKADLTSEFEIGRSQVVKAEVDKHRMRVVRDGAEIANYPASYGKPSNPDLHTHEGTYTVMAKHPVEIMDNPKYGYTDVEKKWAVRISNHGEFIHENENNRANIGSRNTSHGCVNLTNADAKEYFQGALIGDPVEVTGSGTRMPPKYAVYDWMLSWQQWKQKSAL